MRSRFRLLLLVCTLAWPMLLPANALAQGAPPDSDDGPAIQFNGLGRSYLQQTELGGEVLETDTSSVQSLTDGEFVLDLALNGRPNDVTEVQGVIRLRNEFGGFFGAGVTVEVRELWARGIIADVLRYRLGDMNVALTPYTLYLTEEDGVVNEPELFRPQKELIYYEEFYTGDYERRLQGGKLDFGLAFDRGIESAEAQAFFARIRSTDFLTTPTRLIAGGRFGGTSVAFGGYGTQAEVGANLAHTWDDLESGDANFGIKNTVVSGDADLTLYRQDGLGVHLVGEGGWSDAKIQELIQLPDDRDSTVTLFEEDDTFIEIGLAADLDDLGVRAEAYFVDVGPDFYSASAQSKRIDYSRTLSFYNRLGNARAERQVTLFDITRDPAVYTSRIANALMNYDPRYNNTLPFGRATPNRRGGRLDLVYADAEVPVSGELTAAALQEIRGQGTEELKDFLLLRVGADVEVNRLIGWRNLFNATLGLQVENTSRGGEEVEQVDLASTLFEAGLAVEVYDRLDVLVGGKFRASEGNEFLPVIENFNDVRNFTNDFITDDRESLIGAGLRYRFKEGVFLTVQAQRFTYSSDAMSEEGVPLAEDYELTQLFALYSMSF